MASTEYIALCAEEPSIPLFMQPYWLDAVVPDRSWQGLIARDAQDQIRAAWAIVPGKRRGLSALQAPPLTPYTGIWLNIDESLALQKQAAQRQQLVGELERQLPSCSIFEQKLHPSLQDWMPFYWAGYRQETRYTFNLDCGDADSIYRQFSDSFRRNLRAAERQFEVSQSADVQELYTLIKQVFSIRGEVIPFSLPDLQRVYDKMTERGQCAVYRASDDTGVRSVIFVVWDAHTTYYLLGGRVGSNTKSSTNLLLWRAIRDAGVRGHLFDFEGSMIRGVHRFFQSFGAHLQPYLYLYRYRGLAKVKYLRQ